MKLTAYRFSNKGIKKCKFYADECPGGRLGKQGEWTKTGVLLLLKVNRERGNLTPESYFNKNPAGKAQIGKRIHVFFGHNYLLQIMNLFDWHVKAT